ncbi:MAG TPA: chitinase [Polyangiaceae bacterium]|nr:chitinase [Polyangiaceae bacterium]
MVRRLFSVLMVAAIAIACGTSNGDGARNGNGTPNSAAGAGVIYAGNGQVISGGGAAPVGGAGVVVGGGAAPVGGSAVATGGAAMSGGNGGAGGGPGPLCGGPAIPAMKGRCQAGAVVAKGSALMIHDFEDPGPDNDYLGVFFGDGRSGKWFDSHDLTNKPVVTMAVEPTTGGPASNTRALHYKGAAPNGWGATLGLTVANCYDAKIYQGVSFYIKGSPAAGNDQVKFSLHSPISEPAPNGGCSAEDNAAGKCYDHFAKVITLTDQWTRYNIKWKDLTQHCASDPAYVPQSEILVMSFSILNPAGGFDFWVDNMSFDTGDLTANGFADIVPKAMFEEMWQTTKAMQTVNQRNPFYTYEGLVAATQKWPNFCTTGTPEERRREAAMFLSNIAHETDSLALVEENGCAADNVCTQYGTAPNGKTYHGRGPIQLSYSYNYEPAGQALGSDLKGNPELVATDPTISFGTALWFWNTYQSAKGIPHEAAKQGLGATINIINGIECGGGNAAAVADRIKHYKRFCEMLGVDPGPNQGC